MTIDEFNKTGWVQREDGYYVCECDYDFLRGIFWWDSDKKEFSSAGSSIPCKENEFTFISKKPIDVFSDFWKMIDKKH